jgi:HSP20 family protein
MRLKSLVPFREGGALMRPDFGLFGLHREIDRLFSEFAQGIGPGGAQSIVPNIEITETDKAIEVSAEMPGLERKDVEISIEDDTLTIRGEKKVEENQKDRNVQLSDRGQGSRLRRRAVAGRAGGALLQRLRAPHTVERRSTRRPI